MCEAILPQQTTGFCYHHHLTVLYNMCKCILYVLQVTSWSSVYFIAETIMQIYLLYCWLVDNNCSHMLTNTTMLQHHAWKFVFFQSCVLSLHMHTICHGYSLAKFEICSQCPHTQDAVVCCSNNTGEVLTAHITLLVCFVCICYDDWSV